MKTLLLSKTDVQNAVSMDDVIVAVEEAPGEQTEAE